MEIATYSNFRQNLKSYLDSILQTHAPLFVKRARGEDVVVMSKADYEGMQETIYLLSSPRNAERIEKALSEYNDKKGEAKQLID
ncbi:type II toxin-antitoxin system Phd/YefM family antitoxin [Carboxylicivirga sp. N1Y90]|uniref:type II toxin-antitoxin system Phd/YefM family antitoxin n=1 Tax=Carboxylicivirga fragile TaxID=3417571 RepID=UPI003D33C6A6|nr:type II toxin-antitoxin system Phd/YefM family antitoxin [Marinilabiliaceae bacterium N1Y90]